MSVSRQTQLAGLLVTSLGALGFSAKAILVKLAYRHGVDTITLLALRMLFSAPLFLILLWWASSREKSSKLGSKDRLVIVAIGLLGYYGASLFDFLGLQYITAALERLVLFLYPTFVVMFSVTFLGQRIRRLEIAGLLASYGGIALVFINDLNMQQSNVVLGTCWVLLSALCYAGYLIGSGRLVQRVGSMRFAALSSLVACLGVGLHFALTRAPELLIAQPLPVHGLSLLMAVFSTVLPIMLTTEGIRLLGSSKAAIIGTLGPVVTISLGYVFLDESITTIQILGATLVLAGVLAVGLTRSQHAKPSAVGEAVVRRV